MAILKIARMGHPVLRRTAERIDDPADPVVGRLIEDMIATMRDADGAGLGAPQVHTPLRLVIFRLSSAGGRAGAEDGAITTLINPEIEVLDRTVETGYEGCLSLPGLTGPVPRFKVIRYRGLDREGRMVERVAEGFHARVVQHECDHLDGVLYPMRMTDLSELGFVDEVRRAMHGGQ